METGTISNDDVKNSNESRLKLVRRLGEQKMRLATLQDRVTKLEMAGDPFPKSAVSSVDSSGDAEISQLLCEIRVLSQSIREIEIAIKVPGTLPSIRTGLSEIC
jgi:hypothetical protein